MTVDNSAITSALHQMYNSRGADAVDLLRPFLSSDFVFTPGGSAKSQLQADYVGAEGFLQFIAAQSAWTDDSWWPDLDELLVGERWIVGVVRVHAKRAADGKEAEFQIIHRWQLADGKIIGFLSFNNDRETYDDFHSTPNP